MVKTSTSNAVGVGSIPGQGAKILQASWPANQNVKQKQYSKKFNKDFKNGPHPKKKKFKEKKIKQYDKCFIRGMNVRIKEKEKGRPAE